MKRIEENEQIDKQNKDSKFFIIDIMNSILDSITS